MNIQELIKQNKQTIQFGVIGLIGFIVNYTTLKLGVSTFGLNRIIAEIFAAIVALQVTFLLHDRWTYRIDIKTHTYSHKFSKRYRVYLVSNSFASLLTVVFFALFSIFVGHLLALALAAVVGLLWNFLVNKKVIWHHQPNPEA